MAPFSVRSFLFPLRSSHFPFFLQRANFELQTPTLLGPYRPLSSSRNWTVFNHMAGASFDTDLDIKQGHDLRETLPGRTRFGGPLMWTEHLRTNTFGRRPGEVFVLRNSLVRLIWRNCRHVVLV
jgi:hypothetical protein